MSPRSKTIFVFCIGLVSGGALASAAAYFYVRDFFQFPFVSASSEGMHDISVLRKLRSGDVVTATQLLENDLTTNALSLVLYAGAVSKKDRDPAICRGAATIREYREKYPDTAESEELSRTMQEGLAIECK